MYPLSNALGTNLAENYDNYHYHLGEGPYGRVSCEDGESSQVHLSYTEIPDHYPSQSQTSDDFQMDHRTLEGYDGHGGDLMTEKFPTPIPPQSWDCTLCGVGTVEEGSGCTTAACEGSRRPIKRRNTANKKERRRTQSINNAFTELRDCIPNVPADTKLSKIKTLRLATSYITYLSEILSGDDPFRTPTSFTADLSRRLTRGGSGEDKKKEGTESSRHPSNGVGLGSHRIDSRRGKGRTGWPTHVWQMNLG